MKVYRSVLFFFAIVIYNCASSVSAVSLSKKHLIILRAGIDSVWGDYIFSVHNSHQESQTARIPLFLPVETVDFRAIEGITATDLVLDTDGGVILQKDFSPGVNIVNVGFKVAADSGKATMTFIPEQELKSLNVLFEGDILTVSSDSLVETELPEISGADYQALQIASVLSASEKLLIKVDGIPVGRQTMHLFAMIFIIALISFGVVLGIKTYVGDEQNSN